MRPPGLRNPFYDFRLLQGKLRGWRPIRRAERNLRVDPDHHDFWESLIGGVWEPHSLAVVDRYVRPGDVVYDVGAWIGAMTLWAAHRARAVYSLEPDAVAYHYLIENLRLNNFHHVRPFHLGLGTKTGPRQMFARGGAAGDSGCSVLEGSEGAPPLGPPVHFVTIQDWLRLSGAPPPDFVKIDIEGAEFELIPALAPWLERHRPVLYLATHAPHLPEEERHQAITRVMEALSFYPRVEDGRRRELDTSEVIEWGLTGYVESLFLPGK